MTVNDALTNEALENVTATILRLDDGEEQVAHKTWILLQRSLHQVIAEGAFPDSNGELTVSLLAAGHYEVQVILSLVTCFFPLVTCFFSLVTCFFSLGTCFLSFGTCFFLVSSSRCPELAM